MSLLGGGDHIHLAVNLVREDGTKASTHNDYKRASVAVAELEGRHGLEVVAGRHVGRSAPAENRAEVHRARAAGAAETYSSRLARTVRAVAAVADSEDEFVRRSRSEGLWLRPRFRTGGQDVVVTGYAVAERPPHGERAVWKPGGPLGSGPDTPAGACQRLR